MTGPLFAHSAGAGSMPRGAFSRFANITARITGKPVTFATATVIVIVWAATGPHFGYSDTWQLVINTGTTIITFLMVFLIQNTRNRDTMALHLKLDEIIIALENARNEFVAVEELPEHELEQKKEEEKAKAGLISLDGAHVRP
jgi:low affinity Fe/Cu permease